MCKKGGKDDGATKQDGNGKGPSNEMASMRTMMGVLAVRFANSISLFVFLPRRVQMMCDSLLLRPPSSPRIEGALRLHALVATRY